MDRVLCFSKFLFEWKVLADVLLAKYRPNKLMIWRYIDK